MRFENGAIVFWRARSGARDPETCRVIAEARGVDPEIVPEYAGDRVAITRAITQASKGLAREGYLLRPIKRNANELVFGIVSERRDENTRQLDHDHEATVSWTAEPDPSIVVGDHFVAERIREAYRQFRGKITTDDWTSSVAHFLTNDAHACGIRGDGRVYWVPPQSLEDVNKVSAFLSDVGIDLVLCEIEPESKTVVQQAAQESIDDALKVLSDEVEAFDLTSKPSSLERRLETFKTLRQRAGFYRDALSVGVSAATDLIDRLEKVVEQKLTLRESVVVGRDGEIRPVSVRFSKDGDVFQGDKKIGDVLNDGKEFVFVPCGEGSRLVGDSASTKSALRDALDGQITDIAIAACPDDEETEDETETDDEETETFVFVVGGQTIETTPENGVVTLVCPESARSLYSVLGWENGVQVGELGVRLDGENLIIEPTDKIESNAPALREWGIEF